MKGKNCYKSGNENGHINIGQVAIVMVPFPAQGHLNQLLHLSHLIMTSYGLPVHYAGSTVHNRQVKLRLHGWDRESSQKIEFHDLPLPSYTVPPPNPKASLHFPAHCEPLFYACVHLREPMYQLLLDLSSRFKRIIVIHDILIGSIVQDVKLIPNAEVYTLLPVSAFNYFRTIWETLPNKPFQLRDSDLPSSNIPSSEFCYTPEAINFISKQQEFQEFQSGILFNTSRIIESRYLELVDTLLVNSGNMKNFAIGPFNPMEIKISTSEEQIRHGCVEWLDRQEGDSVIYVSFGTTTTMSDEQIRELAKGLEQSGEKFIWVLRRADRGDIFVKEDRDDGLEQNKLVHDDELLELGYEERVKERGIVVRDWAPQLEILAHPSTAWFMTHCGWNSCLESISMGVPIAAWPMHSDQPNNAFLLSQLLKVGIMVRDWERQAELVKSDTIEDALRRAMTSKQGKEMRKRAKELGQAIRDSAAQGGASRLEMESFIAHITR